MEEPFSLFAVQPENIRNEDLRQQTGQDPRTVQIFLGKNLLFSARLETRAWVKID